MNVYLKKSVPTLPKTGQMLPKISSHGLPLFSTQCLYMLAKFAILLLTRTPLESNRKAMKSVSGKRPPDEAHGPGKEAIRPQQLCLRESRKEGAHVHAAPPNSKIQLNFVKHFRMIKNIVSKCRLCFAIVVQNSPILIAFFKEKIKIV